MYPLNQSKQSSSSSIKMTNSIRFDLPSARNSVQKSTYKVHKIDNDGKSRGCLLERSIINGQLDFDCISESAIMNFNPILNSGITNYPNAQYRKLLLPDKVQSCNDGNNEKHGQQFKKGASVEVHSQKELLTFSFIRDYTLCNSAVHVLRSLHTQIRGAPSDRYISSNHQQAVNYFINLKCLITLLEMEGRRKQLSIQHNLLGQTVEMCYRRIKALFRDLLEERETLNESMQTVSEDIQYLEACKNILSNPDKTFSIFSLSDTQPILTALLRTQHKRMMAEFKQSKSALHLRLCLLFQMSIHHDEIFSQNMFSRYMEPIMSHFGKTEEDISGNDIQNYIMDAQEEVIVKHHQLIEKLAARKKQSS